MSVGVMSLLLYGGQSTCLYSCSKAKYGFEGKTNKADKDSMIEWKREANMRVLVRRNHMKNGVEGIMLHVEEQHV